MLILDILQKELDERLPYWLSPEGRRQHIIEAIRAKYRQRWIEAQRNNKDDDARA